ncbi:MAG: DUF3341 domain-containing protein [Alphaproteobacteria bacterium]|nr:MAG: DUF3341 domain-containing protein [Alphaproteobacteria bacterium]
MNSRFVVGTFDDEEKLMAAAISLKNEGVKIYDIYTPFPVHGLDEILDISRSRLPFVTFASGLIGLTIAAAFQIWTSAFAWPINVGGKPMLSIPAFVPIAFEIMILLGALTTVAAFLFKSNLFPTKEEKLFEIKQTDDAFVIVLKGVYLQTDLERLYKELKSFGASKVRLQE